MGPSETNFLELRGWEVALRQLQNSFELVERAPGDLEVSTELTGARLRRSLRNVQRDAIGGPPPLGAEGKGLVRGKEPNEVTGQGRQALRLLPGFELSEVTHASNLRHAGCPIVVVFAPPGSFPRTTQYPTTPHPTTLYPTTLYPITLHPTQCTFDPHGHFPTSHPPANPARHSPRTMYGFVCMTRHTSPVR